MVVEIRAAAVAEPHWTRGVKSLILFRSRNKLRVASGFAVALLITSVMVADALHGLDAKNIILITPYGDDALARETVYLAAVGFTIAHAVGLGRGEESSTVAPKEWVAAACAHDRDEADGISRPAVLSFLKTTEKYLFRSIKYS